jgi:hypothetical protein
MNSQFRPDTRTKNASWSAPPPQSFDGSRGPGFDGAQGAYVPESPGRAERPLTIWKLVGSGVGAFLVFGFGLGVLSSYDLDEGNLRPGVVLAAMDMRQAPKDHTLEFAKGMRRSQMLIWDFAAEDGDQVEVLADGARIYAPFIIKNVPLNLNVPVGTIVEVRGIIDGGGGGITYAVNFPEIGKSITNSTDQGGGNKYTLAEKK